MKPLHERHPEEIADMINQPILDVWELIVALRPTLIAVAILASVIGACAGLIGGGQ